MNEFTHYEPGEFERVQNKERVVSEFQQQLESAIPTPFSYLVYGSMARGVAKSESDIDSMVVFPMNDTGRVLQDRVIYSLPFERPPSDNLSDFYDESDRDDILKGNLDFLRIEGRSMGEEVELQFFPLESLIKACTPGGGNLTAGKKNLEGEYYITDPQKTSIEQTYRGQRFTFMKGPRLAPSGRRIDTMECGLMEHQGDTTRGVSLEKLLCPRMLVDRLGLREFIDNRVLKDFVFRVLQSTHLFVYDQDGHMVGIKKQSLDHSAIMEFLGTTKTNQPDARFELGTTQEVDFKSRLTAQLHRIIQENSLKII